MNKVPSTTGYPEPTPKELKAVINNLVGIINRLDNRVRKLEENQSSIEVEKVDLT